MKKLLVVLLSVCIALGACLSLAGCGDNKETGDVVFTLVYGTAPRADTALVEAEVSKIAKEKLGFGVKFKPVSVFEAGQQYVNWLAAGDEIDVIGLFFVDVPSFIKNKSVREIDSLLTEENAPNILDIKASTLEEIKNKGSDGKVYGITVMPGVGAGVKGGAYMVRKDILETVGLLGAGEGQYADGQKITYSDLDKIFAAIKANPETAKTQGTNLDVYPTGNLAVADYSTLMFTVDPLGATSGTGYPAGGLVGTDSTEIVNIYKSAEYKAVVEKMGEWKSKGYVHPDADSTTSSQSDLFKAGQFVGAFFDNTEAMEKNQEDGWAEKYGGLVRLPFVDPYYILSNPNSGWHIPSRSKRPVSAMKFIDLLATDVEVMNCMMNGLDGKHRVWVDQENYIVDFPVIDGVKLTSETSGYFGMPGIYGDHSKVGSWMPKGVTAEQAVNDKMTRATTDEALLALALANPSKGVGYTYDASAQSARIGNINTVIAQYAPTLSIGKGSKGTDGTYTGPNSTYDKFIKALDDAKIGTVIADNQAQFNAWLASK